MTTFALNPYAIKAIYRFEMARTFRTVVQSIAAPVISTSLYFIVFGAAIGSRMAKIDGVTYGAFIVPGLLMLSILTESISNGSFGIYMPKFAGTIYEVLSAPDLARSRSSWMGYVGAATSKSVMLGRDHPGHHRAPVRAVPHRPPALVAPGLPGADQRDLQPVRLPDRHLGRRLGEALDHPDDGGDAAHLPGRQLLFGSTCCRTSGAGLALTNPVVYLVSGFRWSFYGVSDVGVGVSLGMTLLFMLACLTVVWWIFKTGWRLKT